jgi:hypothetical protein
MYKQWELLWTKDLKLLFQQLDKEFHLFPAEQYTNIHYQKFIEDSVNRGNGSGQQLRTNICDS